MSSRGRVTNDSRVQPQVVRETWGRRVSSGWSVSGRTLAVVVAGMWLMGLGAGGAHAHTLDTQGFSEISLRAEDVRYELLVDYAALAIVTGLGTPGATVEVDPEVALAAGADQVADYLDERLQVLVDGIACVPEVTRTGIESSPHDPVARVSLLYDCPGTGAYTIRYSVLVGDLDPGHRNLAGYALGDATGEFVFDGDDRELSAGDRSLPRQLYRFGVLGFGHILGGLDHVLFVVALLVGARVLGDVLGVVTAFTLAHSVTLALAALDVVQIPSSVIEPLIALSIAYVAVTTLLGSESDARVRLTAVFGFGLLHGAGFASALRFTGDVGWPMLASLASFNVGVEVGQALVVVVLFPLLLFVRQFEWSRHVHVAAASLIALTSLVWFVERLVPAV